MSRSRKKHPVCTFKNVSEKEDKQRGNRRLRRESKMRLHTQEEDAVMHIIDEVLNKYDMAKDDYRGWDSNASEKDLRK